jgi:hypothetical protein
MLEKQKIRRRLSLKTVERIIIKLILLQCIFLVAFQFFLSREDVFMEFTKLAQYEGVTNNNYTKIMETFNAMND